MEKNGVQNGSHSDTKRNGTVKQDDFKEQLVRLMVQALEEYGYEKAAAALEGESGVQLQSAEASSFCACVRNGEWDNAIAYLDKLDVPEADVRQITFLLHEHQYLELLESKQTTKALECLHKQLTPIDAELFAERLHRLSACLLHTTPEKIAAEAGYDPPASEHRDDLLMRVRTFISPHILLPRSRLETLAKQALDSQRASCVYHNTLVDSTTLYSDHQCTEYEIPQRTSVVLDAHTDEVWHVQFCPDGKLLASASKDSTIIVWEVNDDQKSFSMLRVLSGHSSAVSFVAWSPDNLHLLSCSHDDAILLWDARSGEKKELFKGNSEHTCSAIRACAWLPSGQQFVAGSIDKKLRLIDIEGNTQWTAMGGHVLDLAISADGKRLVVICQEKKIYVYDLPFEPSATPVVITERDTVTSLHLAQDGRFLLVNVAEGIHMWDLEKRHLVQMFRGQKQSRFVIHSCFGGAGEAFVASGSEDSLVYVWHRQRGALLEVLEGHSGVVNSVAWSPTNPYMLASCSDDGTVRIWQPTREVSGEAVVIGREKITVN